jgi:DNA (cytosine-5)-methyltransferase 1
LITEGDFVNELALFAGAGGGILGGKLLGWRTVCAVEWEPYPASVLCARQNDKILPPFPIWDDVQTFDGTRWKGIVDVVSGGFPCQDISAAGKGVGIDGERSGMWGEMARIIHEVRPRYAFVENSPMLTSRGLGRVLGNLASMGFDAKWGVLGAADVGANHQRDRIWILAKWRGQLPHSQHNRIRRWEQQQESIKKENGKISNSTSIRQQGQRKYEQSVNTEESCNWEANYVKPISSSDFWKVEPNVGRVVDGLASRMDRLKAIGNGQVPLCAATAWRILSE